MQQADSGRREGGGVSAAGYAAGARLGITLLELLIVLAVVAVLIFITLPTLKPTQQESAMDTAKDELLYLHAREQAYFNRYGKYAPLSTIAKDPALGKDFDARFASDNPTVENISFRGPAAEGPIFDITATLPDGSRYKIDQTGRVVPLQ